MGFPRQKCWSRLPFPSPGDLPVPRIEPISPAFTSGFFTAEHQGNCYKVGLAFPGSSDGKEPACNAGHPASTPGLERSPGEGNGKPFQYSCLENPMDREAWWATVHGVTKSWTQLSD